MKIKRNKNMLQTTKNCLKPKRQKIDLLWSHPQSFNVLFTSLGVAPARNVTYHE